MNRARNLARSGWLNVAFQIAWLAVLYLFGRDLTPGWSGLSRHLGFLGLALVPSAVWATFYYLQDRREPEPTRHVVLSFVAGMAVAALAALPLLQHVFRVQDWIYRSTVDLLLGATLVVGGVTTVLFYLVLRHLFLPMREFDEPADGMAYGAFVGSGFAFVTSVELFYRHPESALFVHGYTASTNILVYATVGALIGYFMARGRFSVRGGDRDFVLGVVVGTVLLGLYHGANEFVFLAGREGSFWLSFLLTVAYAAAILGVAYRAMRGLTTGDPETGPGLRPGPDVRTLAVCTLLLAGAVAVTARATADRTFVDAAVGLELAHPASFSVVPPLGREGPPIPGRILLAADMGVDGARLVVVARDFGASGGPPGLEEIDPLDYVPGGDPETVWVDRISVGGRPGLRVKYATVRRPDRSAEEYPRMVWAIADVVPADDHTVVFSLRARPETFSEAEALYVQVLESVSWSGGGE